MGGQRMTLCQAHLVRAHTRPIWGTHSEKSSGGPPCSSLAALCPHPRPGTAINPSS